MTTTTLGEIGITVNPICIGAWAWGDSFLGNYGSNYDPK